MRVGDINRERIYGDDIWNTFETIIAGPGKTMSPHIETNKVGHLQRKNVD